MFTLDQLHVYDCYDEFVWCRTVLFPICLRQFGNILHCYGCFCGIVSSICCDPKTFQKMGSAKLISGSMMISIIGIIIRMFLPQSIAAQMVGYLAVSLPNIINACVLSQVNYELMEYGRYKTGVVAEGMYSAFISLRKRWQRV